MDKRRLPVGNIVEFLLAHPEHAFVGGHPEVSGFVFKNGVRDIIP